MALSKSQTQKLWRARRDIKARFFENLDRERQDKLAFPTSVTDKPEGAALAHFFINYPLCCTPPASLTIQRDALVVGFDLPWPDVIVEAAAATVALSEVSSLPVRVITHGHRIQIDYDALRRQARQIADEVRDMRAARMWGAQ